MKNNLAVDIDNVTVEYKSEFDRPLTIKEYFIRWMSRDMEESHIRALTDVSLSIESSEFFGIIGRNGAGKSTLLKVIAGIIRPRKGRVQVWGKVHSLLGVGAGLHPQLTGLENIYLYSSLLGRTREETKSLEFWIVEFAELGDFIHAPIRTYSSGMVSRLGFSVAMASVPEILLVDEVLGVGDKQFREKCSTRFGEIQEEGTTIILVSHSFKTVQQLCSRALLLKNGRVDFVGAATEATERIMRKV